MSVPVLQGFMLWRAQRKAKRAMAMVSRWLARYEHRFSAHEREELKRRIDKLRELMERGKPREIKHAAASLVERAERSMPLYKRGVIREWVEPIASALVIALFLRAFVVQAFKIPSGSMYPTLLVGDHVLVNRFGYGFMIPFTDVKVLPFLKVKRGDVIVFKWPQDPDIDFIKRVVGLPGDTIEIHGTNLYINGKPCELKPIGPVEDSRELHDCRIRLGSEFMKYSEAMDGNEHLVVYAERDIARDFGPIKVPEGHYFVMGDNRDCSNDSRYWGFVPFKYIKGKALIIYWSWGPHQLTRIGKLVR